MEKTFTVAGFSVLAGVRKLRVANDMTRVKVLLANGHTDIQLQELPHPMPKEQAAAWLGGAPVVAAVVAPVVAAAVIAPVPEDAPADHIKWLKEGEKPAQEPGAITYKTFEAALAAVPLRSDKGHFIRKEVREALARDMVAV